MTKVEISGEKTYPIFQLACAIRESGPKPGSGIGLRGITAGPDGNLWFTEYTGNAIAEFRMP